MNVNTRQIMGNMILRRKHLSWAKERSRILKGRQGRSHPWQMEAFGMCNGMPGAGGGSLSLLLDADEEADGWRKRRLGWL